MSVLTDNKEGLSNTSLRCVDLFAGCGGMSLGFAQAGFDVVAAMDHWSKAVDVYRQNFAHPCHVQDLSAEQDTCALIQSYAPDVLLGGPPCQDFSSAGKRDVTLGRADLTRTFARIVTEIQPAWFVMENVARIKGTAILQEVFQHWTDGGYGLSCVILDASLCGVPQRRKRLFVVGERGGAHNRLNAWYAQQLAAQPMTVRDHFGDALPIEYYYRHPRTYARRGIFTVDEPSPTIRGVNRPVPQGYAKHTGDPPGAELDAIRPLTTQERAQIQTFPPTFRFDVAKTHAEQMIGNAVPVALAAFVASGIHAHLAPSSRAGTQSVPLIPQRVLRPPTAV